MEGLNMKSKIERVSDEIKKLWKLVIIWSTVTAKYKLLLFPLLVFLYKELYIVLLFIWVTSALKLVFNVSFMSIFVYSLSILIFFFFTTK